MELFCLHGIKKTSAIKRSDDCAFSNQTKLRKCCGLHALNKAYTIGKWNRQGSRWEVYTWPLVFLWKWSDMVQSPFQSPDWTEIILKLWLPEQLYSKYLQSNQDRIAWMPVTTPWSIHDHIPKRSRIRIGIFVASVVIRKQLTTKKHGSSAIVVMCGNIIFAWV